MYGCRWTFDWEIEQIESVFKPLAALTLDEANHDKLIKNFPNLLEHMVDPEKHLISLHLMENRNRGYALSYQTGRAGDLQP